MNRSFIKKFKVSSATFSAAVFIVLCAIALIFVSCTSQRSPADGNAIEALEAVEASSPEGVDILVFAQNLVKNHVGIAKLVSISDFCESAIAASERLDAVAAAGAEDNDRLASLYFELSKLAAMLHDGHTGVSFPQEIIPYLEYYPYNASVIGGKIVVTTISAEYDNVVGKDVVELNGKTVDEVLSALKQIISFDTEAFAVDQACNRINMRAALEFTGIGSDDGILRMKFSDGSEISLEPISYEAFNNCSFTTLVTNVERTLYPSSYYECYDLSDDTLFVQYNACMNADGYSVADFSNDVLGFIDNNGFSRIIVDLRFNGGGNSMLLDPFISQLGKRISAGQCKGFVLIGTSTFSSAVLNAWDLKKAGCMLVGTPTGGAINHYGELGYITLPNSGFFATYSTKHFVLDANAAPGSILPDVFVELSVEDLRNGHDSQVAACMEM